MGSGEIVHFAPYRANGAGIAAIEPDTFVEHQITHGFVLNVVVIFLHQECGILIKLLLTKSIGYECVTDLLKLLGTLVFGRRRFGHGIYLVIRGCENPVRSSGLLGSWLYSRLVVLPTS